LRGESDMRAAVRSVVASLACLGSGATVLWAADPPYAGTWKLNPAKSDFGETTVTYENMAGGQMKFTTDGLSYTFKADGKDYPTPWGNSAAWKAIDANTWEVTNKTNGKVTGTGTLKLSVDGKSFTVDSRNIKATGETSNDSAVFQRVSGGAGLAGTWKNKNVKIGSPGTVRMSPSGSDGLTLTFVEEKGTWKKDGKPMYKDTFTASADGKTLTDVSGAAATTEKVKLLYDRQ
jgi:hypothetical protein